MQILRIVPTCCLARSEFSFNLDIAHTPCLTYLSIAMAGSFLLSARDKNKLVGRSLK